VNLAINARRKIIMPKANMKYLAILGMSACRINKINVTVTTIAKTIPNPAFKPKIFRTNVNPSSEVVGSSNVEVDDFEGKANLIIFAMELIENNVNSISETILACFLKLGNLLRIPRPKILPCSNPTAKAIKNVIKKFSSAIAIMSKIKTPYFDKKSF